MYMYRRSLRRDDAEGTDQFCYYGIEWKATHEENNNRSKASRKSFPEDQVDRRTDEPHIHVRHRGKHREWGARV